jgi:O-antigen ligase
VGIYFGYGIWFYKYYGSNFLYPMGFYYIARLLLLDHHRLVAAIKINAVAVAAQSALMIRQSYAGSSPIYDTAASMYAGVKSANGPFNMGWTAAAYLVLWPPLFIYLSASARTRWQRSLWYGCFFVTVFAITRTMERMELVAVLATTFLCVFPSKLRAVATRILLILAIAYIPWSGSGAGHSLVERFQQDDESRTAMRLVAFQVMRTSAWNPLWGVGFRRAAEVMPQLADADALQEREFTLYGSKTMTAAQVAESGSALHNLYLSLLVEFGIVGVLLAGVIACQVGISLLRLYRSARESPDSDSGLPFALACMFICELCVGYVQNLYIMVAPMSIMFFMFGWCVGDHHAYDMSSMAEAKRRSKPWEGGRPVRLFPAQDPRALPQGYRGPEAPGRLGWPPRTDPGQETDPAVPNLDQTLDTPQPGVIPDRGDTYSQ